MVFSSLTFLLFFLPLAPIGLKLLPEKFGAGFFLAISVLFYAFGEPIAALLLLIGTAQAFFAGKAMARSKHARLILVLSLVWHLGVLFVFKYLDFFCGMLALSKPGIPLPAGISFYTFQNIAYLADVYRGKTAPADKPVPYGAYVAFFPQLIAGPIERWQDIGPQLTALRRPNADDLIAGSRLFIAGLGKKLLLADPMGRLFTALLREPESAGFLGCWMGAAAFSFQLLFDFSGYSDMARGLGRMCGVRLSVNFDHPYAAESLRDFWRRWHITLSRWFRDYVYIPLGGSRGGHMRTALNLLITWLLTGLWHGAGWNMVIWGLYWGVILLIERCLPPRKKPLVRVLYRILTLVLVMAGWVVFACDDLDMLWRVLRQMFAPAAFLGSDAAAYILSFLPLTMVCVLLCVPAMKRVRLSPALSVPLYALVLILCIASLAGAGYHPFLYFRF